MYYQSRGWSSAVVKLQLAGLEYQSGTNSHSDDTQHAYVPTNFERSLTLSQDLAPLRLLQRYVHRFSVSRVSSGLLGSRWRAKGDWNWFPSTHADTDPIT